MSRVGWMTLIFEADLRHVARGVRKRVLVVVVVVVVVGGDEGPCCVGMGWGWAREHVVVVDLAVSIASCRRYQKSSLIVHHRHRSACSSPQRESIHTCPLLSSSLSSRSTSASLPSQSFWNKFKNKKSDKESEYRERQSQMALARQRLLTLAYGDMETVRVVSISPFPLPRRSRISPPAPAKLSCEDPIPTHRLLR